LLGIGRSFGTQSVQFTLLMLAWLSAVVSSAWLKERLPRAAPIVLALALVSAATTPAESGFVAAILPLLIADVAVLIVRVGDTVASRGGEMLRRQLAVGLALLSGFYLVIAPVDALSFTLGGEIPGTYPQPVDGL